MILMNDFKAEPAELRQAMSEAAARVFASGWYVLGKEVKAFEQAWAMACGSAHCVGVGNGMDAIELALRALNIGPGDEVITTPMTAFACVLAVLRAGATPVLADIEPDSALLALDSAPLLTPRTRAVLLVHLYGQMRDMTAWTAMQRSRRPPGRGLRAVAPCTLGRPRRRQRGWPARTASPDQEPRRHRRWRRAGHQRRGTGTASAACATTARASATCIPSWA
jgi:hypothetical protein